MGLVHGDEGGNGDKQSRLRAKVVQTAGVLELNCLLVQLEDGHHRPVNKGSVTLCSLVELDANPFQIKKKDIGHDMNGRRKCRGGDDR